MEPACATFARSRVLIPSRRAPASSHWKNTSTSRVSLENSDGHWFRDQTRIASTSSASTSGRRRQSRCRCGSEELNPEEAPTSNKPLDQPARRAGTLESELFLYTVNDHPLCGVSTLFGIVRILGLFEFPADMIEFQGRMKALENFREEVAKPDEEVNLIRASVFVAQHL